MKRTGVRWAVALLWLMLAWVAPVFADDSAEDIMDMLSWWDEYGSYWEEASELIEFAGEDPIYRLAENTVESSE
ncbi:hypothetical protein [Candidatus Thiothrix anitrata]|uniref:Uncharacterized protein n=1 Tax=Candidatus Thiothrix anitrata TaxID=2823902 RepID=A0ABX7X4T2_9GAMM|nr:hypothetical protein [Candidatus Thiothrix anitrata]QTR49718.1 hypothetical protein J8380_16035 [Candidatus Thiothrix anitrata]